MDEDDLTPFEEAWDELLHSNGYNVPAISLEDALFLGDEDRLDHMNWSENSRYGRWYNGEL